MSTLNLSTLKLIAALLVAAISTPTSLLSQDAVRRLTQAEAMKAAIAKPQPEYPPIARQLKVEGKVEIEITIDPSGAVDSVRPLTGNVALTGSAMNALKRWRFEPILSDGKPTRAVAVIAITFKL